MDFLTFLNKLETTLNKVRVSGREDLSRILGTLQAIDEMRDSLEKVVKENGRQADIGTDSGNNG